MNRVHVAGRGAITALGVGAQTFLDGIFAGRSGLEPRRRLAEVDCLTEVAGEVPVEVMRAAGGEAELPHHMALAAAREALGDRDAAGLGLVLSTTKGDLSGIGAGITQSPLVESTGAASGLGNPWRLAARLADDLGCGGPVAAVSCACASGLSALALAGRWIRDGRSQRVVVVGVDRLSAFILRGFSALLALDPGPCRPYDSERRGLSLGEGAGALLLSGDPDESMGLELVGWGESNDANHVTGPSRDGQGLGLAVERALSRAGLAAADIDYVHVHGTGTRYNDASEALGLKRTFRAATPPASGTKAQTGHTLGATGVLESMVALEALLRDTAPGNLGLEETDVDPALSLVTGAHPLQRSRNALKVCAGFGGINAALVFHRPGGGPTPTGTRRSQTDRGSARIVAAGAMDAEGIVGGGGLSRSWSALGLDPTKRLRWKALFPGPFPTFRRLDLLSQFACLTAEAACVEEALEEAGDEARAATALVLGSRFGCLHSDLRFARGLLPGAQIEPAVFPYTLPSTCLGELAIRYRAQGPNLCLLTPPGGERDALEEGLALLAAGEASAALVCLGDCLPPESAQVAGDPPRLAFTALLLTRDGREGLLSLDALREAADPCAFVASTLRDRFRPDETESP